MSFKRNLFNSSLSTCQHDCSLQGHFRLEKAAIREKSTNFSHFLLATQDVEVCDQPDQGCNYYSFQQESGNLAIRSTENETSEIKLCHTTNYSRSSLQSDGLAVGCSNQGCCAVICTIRFGDQNITNGAQVLLWWQRSLIQAKRNGAKTVKWAKMFQSVKV